MFRAQTRENGRYLKVESADLEDTGKYVCTASNLVGVATKRFEVEVRGKRKLYFVLDQ